ncbi:MAG: DUF4139 domain-containing protein [Candidatus Dactylopiibacterium sp.]|nr:DUF4139 domain-containing protein [Candidatus Dactylopiibacterium sp.]
MKVSPVPALITRRFSRRLLRPLAGCLLVCAAWPALAQQATRITRVTLYPGSATVERVARVEAGAKRLEVSGLPAGFDVRTIRVEADAGVRLGEFSVREVARAEAANPRQAELEAQLDALDDRIGRLEIERQSAELVTGYLRDIGKGGTPNAAQNLPGTLAAIRSGGSDALARIQRVAEARRALDKERAVLARELERIAATHRDTRSLVLSLAADRPGDVRLSYQIDGPGWQPVYRATLDSTSGRIDLDRQALIAQNSGEDWSNVALRLSTGQPRNTPVGPQPQTWTIGLRPPEPPVRALAKAMPAPAAMMRAESAAVADAPPLFDVNEVQTAFATEFDVPARISLPSDGRRVTVSLARQPLAGQVRVQIVPREAAAAFLVASAERPQGVWLPGEIQLYRDGAYVGATHWAAQEGERFELPFGQDDRVRVVVKAQPAQEGNEGFMSQRRQRELASVYTITSQHARPMPVTVLEPSPVGTDSALKVESRLVPQPDQQDWQGQRGVVAWTRTLAPGASLELSVRHLVSWPRESTVIGF